MTQRRKRLTPRALSLVAADSIFSMGWRPVCRRFVFEAPAPIEVRPGDRARFRLSFPPSGSEPPLDENRWAGATFGRGSRRFQRSLRHSRPIPSGREPLALGRALVSPRWGRKAAKCKTVRHGRPREPDPVSGSITDVAPAALDDAGFLRCVLRRFERHLAVQGLSRPPSRRLRRARSSDLVVR